MLIERSPNVWTLIMNLLDCLNNQSNESWEWRFDQQKMHCNNSSQREIFIAIKKSHYWLICQKNDKMYMYMYIQDG